MMDKGDIPSIHCKMSLRGPKSIEQLACVSILQLYPLHEATENIASHNSSLVVWRNFPRGPHKNAVPSGTLIGDEAWPVPLFLHCLAINCLPMAASSILPVAIYLYI
jgi:hypothetical protein